ncbi:MAG: sugar phosphate isomerase/epimerase [Sedimentisphaerales bacterium]|nr:sugar phosphate isomerase/epimerase [Sedimentisphaerales bacterium]
MSAGSRRDFLKVSVLAGTTVSLNSFQLLGQSFCSMAPQVQEQAEKAEDEKPGSKMKLGLVTYLWGQDWDLPTLIANCEKTGYKGVELRVDHAHKVSARLTAEERKAVRKRFADSPVKFVGMGCNWDFHHTDPEKVKANIEGAKADVKLSFDCGGSGVKVKPNDLPKGVPVEKTCEQIGKALNELGRFAADYKQEIRVEVHGAGTSDLPVMKQIFDYVVEKNVGVCWNCNSQDLKEPGLEYNFDLVKKRFGATAHAREFNLRDYPYQELIDLFVKMNYKGWILLEARTKPKDRIAALVEQRQVFEEMVRAAQAKL